MLQQEPGLFLEVKKMLVRKAYSQGRVLDSKELSDEAIFRLVREDEETRSLITQQIVDRGYVRAKPTREELAREYQEEQRRAEENTRRDLASSGEFPRADGEGIRQAEPPSGRLPQNLPAYHPPNPLQQTPQPTPEVPLTTDQSRVLMQASLNDSPSEGDSGGLPLDALAGGDQISPDEIQQLVNAYGKGQLPASGGQADLTKLASMETSNVRGRATSVKPPQSQEEAFCPTAECDAANGIRAGFASCPSAA